MLMLFTASVIGVNFSLHYCINHKKESVSLFSKAECPCGSDHQSHENTQCEVECSIDCHSASCDEASCCSSSHNSSNNNTCGSSFDCCSEQEVDIQIDDAFSISIFKYYDDAAEHFVVDYQQALLQDDNNVCYQKEIISLPEIKERCLHPLTHVYSSYSDDEADSIS